MTFCELRVSLIFVCLGAPSEMVRNRSCEKNRWSEASSSRALLTKNRTVCYFIMKNLSLSVPYSDLPQLGRLVIFRILIHFPPPSGLLGYVLPLISCNATLKKEASSWLRSYAYQMHCLYIRKTDSRGNYFIDWKSKPAVQTGTL